jgi:hypothetical protein
MPPRSHKWGVPILDLDGKIFAQNQTRQRGEANGIAPLDGSGLVPPEFLAAGWKYEELIHALRDQIAQRSLSVMFPLSALRSVRMISANLFLFQLIQKSGTPFPGTGSIGNPSIL